MIGDYDRQWHIETADAMDHRRPSMDSQPLDEREKDLHFVSLLRASAAVHHRSCLCNYHFHTFLACNASNNTSHLSALTSRRRRLCKLSLLFLFIYSTMRSSLDQPAVVVVVVVVAVLTFVIIMGFPFAHSGSIISQRLCARSSPSRRTLPLHSGVRQAVTCRCCCCCCSVHVGNKQQRTCRTFFFLLHSFFLPHPHRKHSKTREPR